MLIVVLVLVTHHRLGSATIPSPQADGFSRVGSVDGQTVWVKREPQNTIALRTSGSLGNMCNVGGLPDEALDVNGLVPAACDDGVGGAWVVAAIVQPGEKVFGTTEDGATFNLTTLPALPGWRVAVAVAVEHQHVGAVRLTVDDLHDQNYVR